jgi:hypothetical protein
VTAVHRDPAVGVPLDGDLAWAIRSWSDEYTDRTLVWDREAIESLARHLTAAGFVKPVTSAELSLGDLRKLADKAQTSITEFLKGSRAESAHSAS